MDILKSIIKISINLAMGMTQIGFFMGTGLAAFLTLMDYSKVSSSPKALVVLAILALIGGIWLAFRAHILRAFASNEDEYEDEENLPSPTEQLVNRPDSQYE